MAVESIKGLQICRSFCAGGSDTDSDPSMKKNHLTKYEQETILNYNRGEQEAYVFTYDPALKRRLAGFAATYPEVARLEYKNDMGGVSYVIDKRRVSIRLTAPYSKERLQKMRRYGNINQKNKASTG